MLLCHLSPGCTFLFRKLASAIGAVLIFPYLADSLLMCLFTLVIMSKHHRLGTILSENEVGVEMSLARAQFQVEWQKEETSLYLVELVFEMALQTNFRRPKASTNDLGSPRSILWGVLS